LFNIKNIMLGKPLKNDQLAGEKLSRLWGLPIMASDAVSSVAYAVEEILYVLIPFVGIGAAGAFIFVPRIVLPILLLLLILAFSYSQIIDHYPNGGGAYIVSKENLGKWPSLIAAASLVVDYIMTVAVSISASTAAIVSAFPALFPYRIEFSVLCVALVTFGNLRGIRESSKIFGLPTYIFIGSMVLMIVVGLIEYFTHNLHAIVYTAAQLKGTVVPVIQQTGVTKANDFVNSLTMLVALKAFSSGCSALTGVEAVSNAIPSFKNPSQRNAKHILFMLAGVIIFIFGGTSILALIVKAVPFTHLTVVSQIAHQIFGYNVFYYIIQIFTSLILVLAANTAYNGLPLLLSILAHDDFVPRQFSHRGTKLSFSNGIMFIFVIASLLIIVFKSDTHLLIPLYTVGVFISFTLSQFGMFRKWRRTKDKGWKYKSWINGFGSLVTLVCTGVVLYFKFGEGAWMLAIAIPTIVFTMYKVNKHYEFVGKQLEIKEFHPYYNKDEVHATQCIVLVQSINKSLLKSLNYANSISDNITALHICRHPEHAKELKHQWEQLNIPIKFEVVLTSYRDIIKPLDRYLCEREGALAHGENLSVIIVKYVSEHWYDAVLHNQTTYYLERLLSRHKNVMTVILPFHYSERSLHAQSGPDDDDDDSCPM
jgi:amino acid transporter